MSPGASRDSLTVGVIANQNDFHTGGCDLVRSSDHADPYRAERFIFLSDFDHRAMMNINGQDVLLRLVRSTETQDKLNVGQRTIFWYTSGSISVRVDYKLTHVCEPDDEKCETFGYSATIRVRLGSASKSVAAEGICGD